MATGVAGGGWAEWRRGGLRVAAQPGVSDNVSGRADIGDGRADDGFGGSVDGGDREDRDVPNVVVVVALWGGGGLFSGVGGGDRGGGRGWQDAGRGRRLCQAGGGLAARGGWADGGAGLGEVVRALADATGNGGARATVGAGGGGLRAGGTYNDQMSRYWPSHAPVCKDGRSRTLSSRLPL